ncbi:ABC transporter permease [Rhodobacteraceae bacterium KMM 6894]|nr:ABC transporter permease [Rhodobacteraceae bacterium KMM 6894]
MRFSFLRLSIWFYMALFFAYLLGPLVIMSITAFNSPSFPRMTPWECLTFEWFSALFRDERILNGIKNSIYVGFGTVILSVAMGLAGALMLTQVWPKLRATYYTIIIAPILIPGVVLGISTLVFWDRVNRMLGLGPDSFLSNGLFLTIIGQSTFIASYCMLVLVARLQRYDTGLTEAALDLGASHAQAFRKILLPFMRPAIASAAVLAFLASFENYNTTTFTFGAYPTLTIELAQKVRYGITPAISALAFIIVALTVFAALANEANIRRKELAAAANGTTVAAATGGFRLPRFLSGNPAAITLVLCAIAVITVVGTATTYSPAQCIADVREKKRIETEKRIQELRKEREALEAAQPAPEAPPADADTAPQSNNSGFGGVFAPGALGIGDDGATAPLEAPDSSSGFGSVFNPDSLGVTDEAPPADTENNSGFGSVFNPDTLGGTDSD